MFSSKQKNTVICLAVSLALIAGACKKKVPPPPPPPPPVQPTVQPPAPKAPVISQFTAEPSSIQRGQSSTLRWEVSGDVTSISIDQGIGTVQATGNRRVSPNESATYTLTATGPGGPSTGSVTVTVSAPPPPPPPPAETLPPPSIEKRLESDVQDAYFDYDKSDINASARETLTHNAGSLKSILADFPSASIMVEGHCDERGSAEYNIGLGDQRASAAKEFLVQLGVPADRMKTISYGKERPVCTDHDESCWQKNRRAHFSTGQ